MQNRVAGRRDTRQRGVQGPRLRRTEGQRGGARGAVRMLGPSITRKTRGVNNVRRTNVGVRDAGIVKVNTQMRTAGVLQRRRNSQPSQRSARIRPLGPMGGQRGGAAPSAGTMPTSRRNRSIPSPIVNFRNKRVVDARNYKISRRAAQGQQNRPNISLNRKQRGQFKGPTTQVGRPAREQQRVRSQMLKKPQFRRGSNIQNRRTRQRIRIGAQGAK